MLGLLAGAAGKLFFCLLMMALFTANVIYRPGWWSRFHHDDVVVVDFLKPREQRLLHAVRQLALATHPLLSQALRPI